MNFQKTQRMDFHREDDIVDVRNVIVLFIDAEKRKYTSEVVAIDRIREGLIICGFFYHNSYILRKRGGIVKTEAKMGRYRGLGRDLVEKTPELTIDDLKAWGCLDKGFEGFCRKYMKLMRGEEETGSLNFEIHIKDPWSYIKFDYRLNGKPVEYEHEIELFPCYFGGYRYYFRCRHCRRRVTALYLSRGYYACRHCHRLAYEVSQKHRAPFEILKRALNLENRAKKRRKHGHPRKANRLLLRAYRFKMMGLIDLQTQLW